MAARIAARRLHRRRRRSVGPEGRAAPTGHPRPTLVRGRRDLDRGDWRSFRLARPTRPQPTGARSAPRRLPAEDAVAFVRAGTAPPSAPTAVEFLVGAPADRVRARIGRWARVEDDGPGRSRVLMEADGLDWPAFAIGTLGAAVAVVSPPEASYLLHEWGHRSSRAGSVVPPDEHGDRPTEGRSP